MKIIVDAFGGDNAPLEIIKGSADAVAELGVSIILTGKENVIRECAKENSISLEHIEIIDAPEVIEMDDSFTSVIKAKQNSSMSVGLKALTEGKGDAFVSAGSTGALVVGGIFIVKRIKGIKRAAIASVLPTNKNPFLLIDSGANLDCTPEFFSQFAVMGNIYMNKVMGLKNPRVGIANIGVEETKGTNLQRDAYTLMKEGNYNFIGNIEVRDIPFGECDVVVADGFTVNVILKMYEGVAGALMDNIKAIFKKSKATMLAALIVKNGLMAFKKKMDYTEFGGAPLLGLEKPVIKAHGSSNAKALKNAIRPAKDFTEKGVIQEIEKNIPNLITKQE